MKLLLDDMIAPRIARKLWDRGHDVQSRRADRPALGALADAELVSVLAAEKRALVTTDVADYMLIHNRVVAGGDAHFGFLFADDATLPRGAGSANDWVKALDAFLDAHPADGELRNRTHYLTRS